MSEESPIEAAVVDVANAEVGRIELPALFDAPVNDHLLFEQVLAQRASNRSGTAATKTRSMMRGGGAKPWRQKGTGRARAGTRRSPLWRGGAVTFGPQPRSYAYRLPRSARRQALISALAQKRHDDQLKVIDRFGLEEPKTKRMKEILEVLGVSGSVLIVLAEGDRNVELSARNLKGVLVMPVAGLNVYDILRYEHLLVEKAAVVAVEERLSR